MGPPMVQLFSNSRAYTGLNYRQCWNTTICMAIQTWP